MLGVVISDLHLSPRIRTGGMWVEGDCEAALVALKEAIEVLPIEFGIVTGDVFNGTRVDSEEIELARRLFTSFKFPMYDVQGNHDRGTFSIPNLCFNSINIDRTSVTLADGTVIYGIKNIEDRETMENCLTDIRSDIDILACHLPVAPFSCFSGSLQMHAKDVAKGLLTIVGDTHITDVFEVIPDPAKPEIKRIVLSPGFLYPANKTELISGNPGFCVISTQGHGVMPEIYTQMLPKRSAYEYRDFDEKVFTELAEKHAAELAPVLYVPRHIQKQVQDLNLRLIVVPVAMRVLKPEDIEKRKSRKSGSSLRERFNELTTAYAVRDNLPADVIDITDKLVFEPDPAKMLDTLMLTKNVKG